MSYAVARLNGAPAMESACESLEARTLFAAPTAVLTPVTAVTTSDITLDLNVTYDDDGTIDPASLGVGDPGDPGYPTSPADINITGPNGFTATGVYVVPPTPPGPAASIVATYRLIAPNGRFSSAANGTYTVSMNSNAVLDDGGAPVAAGTLGTFTVNVPAVSGGSFASAFLTDLAVRATATQADGKVLVAGTEDYARMGSDPLGEDPNDLVLGKRLVIRRFNNDGSVDTSFGTNGRFISTDIGDTDARAILLGSGGTFFVAGGNGYPANFLSLTKFNANGTIATGFGTNGTAQVDFDPNVAAPCLARAVATQSDGKLIVVGQSLTVDGNGDPLVDFALCRLKTDGTLDTSFGTGGITATDASGTLLADGIGSVIVTPTDQIIVAGSSGTKAAVARYSANGILDGTFGTGGVVTLNSLTGPVINVSQGLTDPTVGLARLSSGDLIVAAGNAAGPGFGLTRLSGVNGAIDTSFGTSGLATASFGGTDDADRLLLLPSGKLMAIGTSTTSGIASTAVALFTPGGVLDNSFDTDGLATFDPVTAGTGTARSTLR